jgi:hypothetical protein
MRAGDLPRLARLHNDKSVFTGKSVATVAVMRWLELRFGLIVSPSNVTDRWTLA